MINVKFQVEGESKYVSDIISDMDLTSSSLDSKETLSYNNAFKNFVISIGCILECL